MKPESTITHYRTEPDEYNLIMQFKAALVEELPKIPQDAGIREEFFQLAQAFINTVE